MEINAYELIPILVIISFIIGELAIKYHWKFKDMF